MSHIDDKRLSEMIYHSLEELQRFSPDHEGTQYMEDMMRFDWFAGLQVGYSIARVDGFRFSHDVYDFWLSLHSDVHEEGPTAPWVFRSELLEDGPAPVAA